MPTSTDLVTDLPADFEVFGQAVDTSLADLKGGTSGQILAKNSNTDMDFVWTTAAPGDITAVNVTSPITGGGTSGDVTIGISSSAVVPSQTGNSGKYLTTDGTTSSWGTISSGGMTLLDSGALTGSSVTTASLSQSYKDLYVIIRDWYPATDAVRLRARVNGVSAANSYDQGVNAGTAIVEAFGATYIGLTIDTDNTVHKNILTISIPDYANTTTFKFLYSNSFAVDSSTGTSLSIYAGIYGITAAVDAVSTLTFFPSSGNHSGGNYYVYGVK